MSIVQTVLSAPHFTVMTQDCSYPRINCGHGEGEPARFLLTRRGAFSIQVGNRTCLARPGQAVFLGRDVEYRVSHPDHRGCACCTDAAVRTARRKDSRVAGMVAARKVCVVVFTNAFTSSAQLPRWVWQPA